MTATGAGYSYPLSPVQKGMLFHTLYAPRSGAYVQQLVGALHEELDASAFGRAWQWVADRHPVLRTGVNFTDSGGLLQQVSTPYGLTIEQHDWRGTDLEEREEKLRLYIDADRRRGFDLGAEPLMRLALFRMDRADYRFVWTSHHALLDGRSRLVVLEELFLAYEAFCRGEAPRCEPARPYRDYIEWLSTYDMAKAERFWGRSLRGFTAPTPLVPDTAPQANSSAAEPFATQGVRLSESSTAALGSLARRHGLSLNTLVQGAWALLLSRYSGEEDIVFGATRACRKPEARPGEVWVGLFINTLPVRARVSPDEPLIPWLQRLRAQWRAAREHEHTPLVDVQAWSELPAGTTLFESVVVFEHQTLQSALQEQGGRWTGRGFRLIQATHYPLTVSAYGGPELLLNLGFDLRRFEVATIDRMLGHLRTLLDGMAAHPEARLSELPLLTEGERRMALTEWNDTRTEYPRDRCIHELFEEQVGLTPEAVAVVFEDERLTYRELNRRANQLALHLQGLGVGPEVLVGICMERSLEVVVGMLGILKAGGAYVPLDPAYPSERLAFMLEDMQASVLLSQRHLLGSLPRTKAQVVCVDAYRPVIAQKDVQNAGNRATAESLAYVIYTSGSTGKPKGVCVSHRAVASLVRNTDYARLTSTDVVGQASNPAFDAATWEIWGALLGGAQLVVLPQDTVLSPSAMAAAIEQRHITALFLTTALFNQVARENPAALRPLRHLLFGGEAVKTKWVREVLAAGSPERLLHVYGPTETTTFATWHLVEEVEDDATTIPIGRPTSNTEAYVLDARLGLVPVGVPGELYIGGPGVARAYLNRPQLTDEKFLPHPFNERPEARLYKTGDRVRRRANGDIEFLGRLDGQIKLRGFRIEPGEVESVLGSHAAVRESVVLLREDIPEHKRLTAYLVTASAAPPDSELRAFLRQRLPDYMVPSTFVALEALPLTPNGKIDRDALPAPSTIRPGSDSGLVAPHDALERRLVGIWEQVLGVPVVGANDDFFELGGHSLLAVNLFVQIEKAFGRQLPLATLFRAPTVRQLADVLHREAEEETPTSLVAIQPHGSRPPFFCVHGAGGGVLLFHALARYLKPDQPFYGFQARDPDKEQAAPKVEDIAAAYVRELRDFQSEGPYYLGGYSSGGLVAFEMARRLRAQGHSVALLVLFDTGHPAFDRPMLARLYYHARKVRRLGPLRYAEETFWGVTKSRIRRVANKWSLWSGYSLPRALQRTYSLNRIAAANYVPKPYSETVTLFRSADFWGYPDDPSLGWNCIVGGGVDVHEVPGDHRLFREPHVQVLAAKLQVYSGADTSKFAVRTVSVSPQTLRRISVGA